MPIVNVSFMKAVNSGGRLYTGIDNTNVRQNGDFGYVNEYVAGSTQIRTFVGRTNQPQSRMPVIVMQPEMMYDNSRQSLLKLKNFEIPVGTPFTCVPLNLGDKFDITADALMRVGNTPASGAELGVGKHYVYDSGYKLALAGGNGNNPPAQAGQVYFTIVKVKPAHARSARIGGAFAKDNYNLYTMEVRVK